MSRGTIKYLSNFIFKQKCIPWRMIDFWNRGGVKEYSNRFQLRVSERWIRCYVKVMSKVVLKDIELEKVFTGGFNGDKQFNFRDTPIEKWHPNYLLKESPHVKSLHQFKDAKEIDNEEFKKTEYFRFALKDIQIYGSFFGISEGSRVIERAKNFLSLYRAVRDKTNGRNYIFFPGDSYPKDCFLKVSKVPNSDYYLIREGHHRFAIYYVLGQTTVKARVIGLSKISLEQILLKQTIQNEGEAIHGRTASFAHLD